MYVLTAHLDSRISFLIRPSDPTKLRIREWLHLVNPLVPVGDDHDHDEVVRVVDGHFVHTSSLRFLVTREDYGNVGSRYCFGLEDLPPLLRGARLGSRHPYQPCEVTGESLEWFAARRLPNRRLGGEPITNALLAPSPTAIRIAHRFRSFGEYLRAVPPEVGPVYAELVLDAIASEKTDPRRSILFAAFAVEQMAAHRLDAAYARARRERKNGWRWIDSDDEEEPDPIDPIYMKMRRSAKGNWKTFLFELPLYVWGRSLRHEDTRLYDLTVRLRKVRNALTHEGDPPEREEIFVLDPMGAHMALRTAEAVFAWFRERNYFWGLPREDELIDVDGALTELIADEGHDGHAQVEASGHVKRSYTTG